MGQRGEAESQDLGAIASRVETQDDREAGTGLAQGANAAQDGRGWPRHGGKQAAPRKHHAHAVRNPGERRWQPLDRRPDIEDVGEAGAGRAPGETNQARGVGVDADEQPLGRLTRQPVREPAVAGAEVDGHLPAEAGQGLSESMIRALEALAAYDVHGHMLPHGGLLAYSHAIQRAPRAL